MAGMKTAAPIRRISVLATLALLVSGCVNIDPPTDEQMAINKARSDALMAQQAVRGRALVEAGLQSGTTVFSFKTYNDQRLVIRNIEFRDSFFCFDTMADNGVLPGQVKWANYDQVFQQTFFGCAPYGGVKDFFTRDIRKDGCW